MNTVWVYLVQVTQESLSALVTIKLLEKKKAKMNEYTPNLIHSQPVKSTGINPNTLNVSYLEPPFI